jgi:oligosaccharyl transferase (archaeosortase A-associated)
LRDPLKKVNRSKLTPKTHAKLKLVLEIVVVAFLVAVSFGIRVIPSYDAVVQEGKTSYTSVDDYFYMRIADNLIVNWPNFTTVDLYRNYPEGVVVGNTRLLHPFIIAAASKVTGIGLDTVAAWVPPIYGTLSILFLYIAFRFVFKRAIALIGLAFLCIMPGEFLSRSSLGAMDSHALEILASSFMLSFLLLSLSVKHRIVKIVLATIAGIGLSFYISAWEGAPVFILIILIAIFIWWIIEYFKKTATELPYLQIIICAAIPLITLFITGYSLMQIFSIAGLFGGTCILWILHKKPRSYLIIAAITAAIAATIGWIMFPTQAIVILQYAITFFRWNATSATAEEAPLLLMNGEFSFSPAWIYFAGVMYLFLVGIGAMAYYIIKKNNRIDWLIVLVWSIVIFVAMTSMKRWAYYAAIPMSITAAYICWIFCKNIATLETTKGKAFSPGTVLILVVLISILSIVPFLQMVPGYSNSVRSGQMSPGWSEAVDWLKTTPDPIENGYTSMYTEAEYPDTAYGVMTWWDYGYWVLREGHRITYSDPGGGNRRFCGWFLSTDNMTEVMESVNSMKIKYIIIDYSMTTGKNYSIVQHAAARAIDFQEPFKIYYDRRTGSYNQMQINYISYYQELMVRLYNFNGLAVDSPGCPVFRYEEINGNREIIEAVDLPDYDTATLYVAQHKEAKYIIGGTNPFLSPIKMDALPQFKPVFFSRSSIDMGNGMMIPEVKIFEVVNE